jgi:hypothetical protein
MAGKKINLADLVFKVSDDGTLKVFAGSAKKAGKELKTVEKQQDKTTYATKKGINATANSTKNFANMARGISGSLVPAYATLAANIFALTAVFGFLRQAADYRVLQQGQAAYAAVTGVAYKTLTNTIIEATDAQITYADAAQAAAIGTAAGLSPEQLGKLGEAAKTVSIALGRDLTDSFNRLIRGTTKAEPELLDELGIVLRLETATKNYAAELGVAKESLNAFQRTQAVTNDVLGQVETKFAAINAIIEPETNKINKLAKSFDDLMNTVRDFVAGPAEALAVFFSENLLAAVGALGLFVLPIIQSLLPAFDELAVGAKASLEKQSLALEQAKQDFKEYTNAAQAAKVKAGQAFDKLGTKASGFAQKAGLPKARVGSGMRALQDGGPVTARQAAAVKKQINDRNSAYFVANDKLRMQWSATLDKMDAKHKIVTGKIKVDAKKVGITWKAVSTGIAVGFKAAMVGVTKAAAIAGTAMSKAFGIFSFISLGLLAFEGFMAGARKLGFFEAAADGANTALGKLARTQKDLNKELREMLNADEKLAAEGLDLTMNQIIKRQGDRLTSAALGSSLDALFKTRADIQALKDLQISPKMITGATADYSKGPVTYKGTGTTKKEQDDIAMSLKNLQVSEKGYLEGEDGLIARIQILAKTFPTFNNLLDENDNLIGDLTKDQLKLVDAYTSAAAAVKFLEQSEASYQQTLQGRFGKTSKERAALKQAEAQLEGIRTTMDTPEFNIGILTGDPDAEATNKKFQRTQAQVAAMRKADTGQRSAKVTQDQIKLQQEALKNRIHAATILGQRQQVLLQINQKQSQIDSLRVQIAERKALLDDAEDKVAAQRSIDDLVAQENLLTQQKQNLTDNINLTKQLGVEASKAFGDSMQKGIQGVIEGTMSMKDAFKGMAKAILQSLAQVLAKMMTMRILSSAFGIPMAEGGIIPMAKGGIKGYASGGIATEPTYLVGEAGPEAVVPLPDGRKIPVDLGGNGGTNNVTINVDASGSTSSTGDGEQGKALGLAIQATVMETIQREQRPGGVLGGG